MANIARLGVLLGLDSAEFSKGIDQANNKLDAFGKKIAANAATIATVAVAAFAAAAQQALAYADNISDVAKANDVTIDSIIKLNNALAQSGGKAEDAGKLLSSFTNFVDSAAMGSDDAQKAFTKIGISLKDLGKLSTEDLFGKAIQSIAAIEDPLTRNAKAMDMFGKAAKGVDFVALADGMNTGTGATAAQAKGLQDAADMYDLLAQSSRNFMLLLASELGPVLKTTADYLSTLADKGTALRDIFHSLFAGTALVVGDFASELAGLARNLTAYYNAAIAFSKINIYSTAEERSAGKQILDDNAAAAVKSLAARAAFREQILNPFIGGVNANELGTFDDGTDPEAKRKIAPGKQATSDAAAALKKQLALEHKGFLVREQERADYIKLNEHFDNGNKLLGDKQTLEDQNLTRLQDLFVVNQNVLHMTEDDLQLQRDKLQIANQYDDAVKAIRDNDALTLDAQTKALATQVNIQTRSLALADKRYEISKAERSVLSSKVLQDKQLVDSQMLTRAQDLFVLNQNINHLSEDDLQLARDKLQITNQYDDAVKAIRDNQALTLDAQTKGLQDQLQLQQQALALAQQRRDMSVDSKAGSFAKGFDDSMGKAFRDLPTEMQKGQMAFESVFQNMNSAIDDFVKTGKLNFKSFAQSVIQDMIAIELKSQAMGLLRMAGMAMGFSGGAATAANGASGLGTGIQGFGAAFAAGGDPPINKISLVGEDGPELFVPKTPGTIIPNDLLPKLADKPDLKKELLGFAAGGDPPVNVPSMVGERGPELFVPKSAGTIIPNSQINIGGNGGGSTVNYNGPYIASMSAIDTQSGLQFLAKNKQSVWSAYQSANRSIPMSR
jgi:lambda family phage tail tape measure protein